MTKTIDYASKVGQTALVVMFGTEKTQSSLVPVEILRHIRLFGRDMYVVHPVNGQGEITVNADRIVWE